MISFKNVSKSFSINGKKSLIISDINFSIYKKEIFGLVGETGSGKSTILRLMNGFISPDNGEIYIWDINKNVGEVIFAIYQVERSKKKDLYKEIDITI